MEQIDYNKSGTISHERGRVQSMLFIKTEDLKAGMRLAKPIFSKTGVLLYDRDTKITEKGILSVKNFGLIGLYILEPAEPLPPLSDEDREFERFQTMSVFSLRDDLKLIQQNKKTKNLIGLSQSIIKNYGNLSDKINFFQDIRSAEDYIYKHSLNVAILAALIANKLRLEAPRKLEIVLTALIHDIATLDLKPNLINKFEGFDEKEIEEIRKSRAEAIHSVESNNETTIKTTKMLTQIHRGLDELYNTKNDVFPRLSVDASIVLVAETYDTLTSMRLNKNPISEISAVRTLLSMPKAFPPEIVHAMTKSIFILPPGLCVELTNGEKGLIINENEDDIERPMVLGFAKNQIYDLNNHRIYKDIQIADVMKTMDNRFVIDRSLLEEYQMEV